MAPYYSRTIGRGVYRPVRGGIERHNRNAHTGAMVNVSHSTNQDADRTEDAYHGHAFTTRGGFEEAGNELPRPPVVHGRAFDDSWHYARNSTSRGRVVRPSPQRGRAVRLHDLRIRHSENDDAGRVAPSHRKVSNATQEQSVQTIIDLNNDDVMNVDDVAQYTTDVAATNISHATQGSSLFYSAQQIQVSIVPNTPLTPPSPSTAGFRCTTTPRIRMVNRPVTQGIAKPKRSINKYRGKDLIKKLVQNPKLRAILADRALPKARKKALADRPDLRMGISKITK